MLAGLTPDPLPTDNEGVFVEAIDPALDTLDMGAGGTGVFETRPSEGRGMEDAMLLGNADLPSQLNNNQLQLYCWLLDSEGNVRTETFDVGDTTQSGDVSASANGSITLSTGPTPAIPVFRANGITMDNPTMFDTTATSVDNELTIVLDDGDVIISWEGPGALRRAGEAVGPYSDHPSGTSSPVSDPADQPEQFYRLHRGY